MDANRSTAQIVKESSALAYALGGITLAAGLVLLFWPDRTITVVARIAGLLLLIAGLAELFEAIRHHSGMSYWGLFLARAIINTLFGAALLFWPGPTIHVLVWLLGLDLVIAGAIGLLLQNQMAPEYRSGTTARGVVTILIGVAVMVWPEATLNVIAFAVAAMLIITGLIFLWTGHAVSKADITVIEVTPPGQ